MSKKKADNWRAIDRIALALDHRGWSWTRLAQMTGISSSQWSRWLRSSDSHRMYLDQAIAACRALGVSLDWLVSGEPFPEPTDPVLISEQGILDELVWGGEDPIGVRKAIRYIEEGKIRESGGDDDFGPRVARPIGSTPPTVPGRLPVIHRPKDGRSKK